MCSKRKKKFLHKCLCALRLEVGKQATIESFYERTYILLWRWCVYIVWLFMCTLRSDVTSFTHELWLCLFTLTCPVIIEWQKLCSYFSTESHCFFSHSAHTFTLLGRIFRISSTHRPPTRTPCSLWLLFYVSQAFIYLMRVPFDFYLCIRVECRLYYFVVAVIIIFLVVVVVVRYITLPFYYTHCCFLLHCSPSTCRVVSISHISFKIFCFDIRFSAFLLFKRSHVNVPKSCHIFLLCCDVMNFF